MYCIYSNKDIEDKLCSKQHIIPLSLGGIDDFTISIARTFNSKLGSKVEGALINEFAMKLKQMHSDVTGQSKSPAVMKLKAKINEKPVSIIAT